jgi:isopentenyl-diphosphate delta-isomerase
MKKSKQTSKRKLEHIRILSTQHDMEGPPSFHEVHLLHNALPEIDRDEVALETKFLGKTLKAPLLIASMTGGHPATERINARLAAAAEKASIGIGVGSQRAALEDKSLVRSYRVVRERAPGAFVYGNIGVPQLRRYGPEGVQRVIDMIDADAVAIHLNFLQEAVQPEGDVQARGCLEMVGKVCRGVSRPVMVKETGAGISREVAEALKRAGAAAIDVGGLGGTNFAPVEAFRARARGDALQVDLGRVFRTWGIPTPVSIVECRSTGLPVVATGGIRSGLDAAKALALGATAASAGLPFMKAALKGEEEVGRVIRFLEAELRTALFLTGCRTPGDLRRQSVLFTGATREILQQRGHL